MLSKEDLQAIKEVVGEAVNNQTRESKYQYDRYNKAARLFEDKIMLLDALAEVVKKHSEQIIKLQRKNW